MRNLDTITAFFYGNITIEEAIKTFDVFAGIVSFSIVLIAFFSMAAGKTMQDHGGLIEYVKDFGVSLSTTIGLYFAVILMIVVTVPFAFLFGAAEWGLGSIISIIIYALLFIFVCVCTRKSDEAPK